MSWVGPCSESRMLDNLPKFDPSLKIDKVSPLVLDL